MSPAIGQRIIITHCNAANGLGCMKIEDKSCLGRVCVVTKRAFEYGEERKGEFGIQVLGTDLTCFVVEHTDTYSLVSSENEEFE